MLHKKSEKGQALILIVLAIVGLIGLTALAVDGGMAYSERRQSQNAADSSALAAALVIAHEGTTWQAEGFARALSNGFDNNGTTNTVVVNNPPAAGCDGQAGPYAGNTEYVQVIILASTQTYFGPVIGIDEVRNCVDAIARAKPKTTEPPWSGQAIVSLSPHDCSAVTYQGHADATLVGGGIFVNSDCDGNGNQAAFFNQSGSATLNTPGVCSVGSVSNPGAINLTDGGSIQIGPANCPPSDYPVTEYTFPNAVCAHDAVLTGNTMTPGNWNGNLQPPSGEDTLNLAPGMYCVNGDFDLHAGDTINGEDVVIVINSGTVTWNGGANINLSAPNDGDAGVFEGLLLYLPYTNDSAVTIAGNFNSLFTGTILAPASECNLLGTSGSEGMVSSQVICYTVDIAGNSDTTINYDAGNLWQAPVPPKIELSE
ncbi:MAG: hypothetical protein A3K45_00225 [Chloroflexi bacterium RIFOXYC12_FULL_59_14]|nr:MAG: hypothetical protein A3K45_00225 [Chloroflexi bacterium RIFOXYC12_FULL_59_14]